MKRYFPCGAGRGYVSISNTGDVFLCHRFVGTEDYKIGSVNDNALEREIYLTPTVRTMKKCSECFAKYFCAGGCYHDNLGKTGSVFEPPEDTCEIMRSNAELTAYITANLNDDDIEYLVKEEIISKKPPTKEELAEKKNKLQAEMDALGLTEDELKEVMASVK
jgi:uncharacterized protein